MIDTHAHIFLSEFESDRSSVVARAKALGMRYILMPNLDMDSIAPMLNLESEYPMCRAMMGLHPCYVKKDFEEQLEIIENWLQKRSFIAVGEIGLDFYRDKTYAEEQEIAFLRQAEWAKKYQIPVVIHQRNAFEKLEILLEKVQDGTLKGVLHCFDGTLGQAQRIIDLGLHLGIGGILTFKKCVLTEFLHTIPLENLLTETDSPYLSPVPFRGKRNEPAHMMYVVQKLAQVYQTTPEYIAKVTFENACRLFALARIQL